MTDLERKVLEEIARQKLVPKPAYVFLAKRSVFWALAAVSILLGALSLAILFFVISDYFNSHWRILDNIHYNGLLAIVPLIWLVLLGVFTASATYGLRQTRRGYRFKATHTAAAAFAASLAVGAALHMAEAGRHIHEYLAAHFETYRASTYVPFSEWSRPDQGYLGGTVLGNDGKGTIQIMDFHDKPWTIDVSSAQINLDDTLIQEGDIAITGERTGPDTFRALTISEFD